MPCFSFRSLAKMQRCYPSFQKVALIGPPFYQELHNCLSHRPVDTVGVVTVQRKPQVDITTFNVLIPTYLPLQGKLTSISSSSSSRVTVSRTYAIQSLPSCLESQIYYLPSAGCVNMGRFLSISVPLFPICEMGIVVIPSKEVSG